MKSTLMKSLIAGMIVSGSAVTMSLSAQEPAPAAKPADIKAPVKAEATKVNPMDAIPDVVAQYNGKDITKKDILDEIAKTMKERGVDISAYPPEMIAQGMYGIVSGKLQMDLFADEAAKAGYKIDAGETKKVLNEEFENLKKASPQQYEQIEAQLKAREKMTIPEYIAKEAAKQDIQKQVAAYQWITANAEVSDKDVQKFYDENKDSRFTTPADPAGTVRASHILIPVKGDDEKASAESLKKAEEIIAKLQKDPKLFESIAATDSACPSGKMNKGQLGVIFKDRDGFYGKEFDAAAFALEPGKITDKPIKSEHGYHIIRRDASITKAEVIPLDDNMKARLKAVIGKEKQEEFVQKTFAQALKDGKVKIFVKEPKQMQMPGMMMGQ